MAYPNVGTFNRPGAIDDQASFDAGLRTHMVRVYNYMAAGLALSGIVAFGLFSSTELAGLFFQVEAGRVVGLNIPGWIAIFAPLGLLLLTPLRAARMSVKAVQAVYWTVTALMGVSLSLLLFRYTGASVARTFFVTAAAFGALSVDPSRIMRSACRKPTSRGSRCVPPQPGMSPSITSGKPILVCASSRAIRYRQASANSNPPPRHGPWMTTTVG